MFARASMFEGGFERLQEGVELFRDEVIPQLEKQPGFAGAFLLADRDADTAYAVTLWETRRALVESDELGTQLAKAAADRLGLQVTIRYPDMPVFAIAASGA